METVIDVNNPLEDVVTDGPFAHLRRVKDICFLEFSPMMEVPCGSSEGTTTSFP